MTEVRTFFEGAARWVQASGTGTSWTTASAATSALVGFVQAGVSINSGRDVMTVYERGKPNHFKLGNEQPVEFQLTFLEAVTANKPPTQATAEGASVPAVHWEIEIDQPESSDSRWVQLIHCVNSQDNWTEGEEGNQNQMTWQAIAMQGPTASGYMTT